MSHSDWFLRLAEKNEIEELTSVHPRPLEALLTGDSAAVDYRLETSLLSFWIVDHILEGYFIHTPAVREYGVLFGYLGIEELMELELSGVDETHVSRSSSHVQTEAVARRVVYLLRERANACHEGPPKVMLLLTVGDWNKAVPSCKSA